MSGGYKIIDFHNVNLVTGTENPVSVSGIYSAIENNYRKALMFSGIVIDGVEKANCYASATSGDNSYTVSLYDKTVTISNTDTVSIA